jgi:NAD(P)-dependent dehydrogenase (short-subunit alcohol dehydrogenase family)
VRGQGAAEARLFCAQGASVVLGDVLEPEGQEVAAELIASGAGARFVRLDVAVDADWRRAVETAERELGALDVLVNNAGVTRAKGLERTSEEEWEHVTGINQKGAWLGMRAALPAFRRRGRGAVVNTSSIYGVVGAASSTAYHASKGPSAR